MADAIVCFSMSEWGDVPHNSRQLMKVAHAHGYRVLYVESIGLRSPKLARRDVVKLARRIRRALWPLRRVTRGFWVFSPIALPLHGSRWAMQLNRRLISFQLVALKWLLRLSRPILWSYVPQFVSLRHALAAKVAIYHRTDEYGAMPGVDRLLIEEAEREAVAEADFCLAPAARYIAAGPLSAARKAVWLPNAVDVAHYYGASKNGVFDGFERPVLLMVGTLESWLAKDTLAAVADARPDWTIVLAGPCKTDIGGLLRRPNVRHLGVIPYDDLPRHIASADVCLVPFEVGPITQGATPGKLYQYLAVGKPVVATRFLEEPELEEYVYVADDDGAAFVRTVEGALADDREELRERRRAFARGQTWESRFATVERLFNGELDPRGSEPCPG